MTERKVNEYGVVIESRINLPATLSLLKPGETREFKREALGRETAVRNAISRLNIKAGRREFTVDFLDNGTGYVIRRMSSGPSQQP